MTAKGGLPPWRREIAVSHIAGILAGAGATILGPILPALSRIWPVSDAEAGTLLACEFIDDFGGAMGDSASASRVSGA